MIRLETGAEIGPYRVERFIKDGVFNSNYVVTNAQGSRFFLKLFDLADEPIAQHHLEDSVRCYPSSLGPRNNRTPIGYR